MTAVCAARACSPAMAAQDLIPSLRCRRGGATIFFSSGRPGAPENGREAFDLPGKISPSPLGREIPQRRQVRPARRYSPCLPHHVLSAAPGRTRTLYPSVGPFPVIHGWPGRRQQQSPARFPSRRSWPQGSTPSEGPVRSRLIVAGASHAHRVLAAARKGEWHRAAALPAVRCHVGGRPRSAPRKPRPRSCRHEVGFL